MIHVYDVVLRDDAVVVTKNEVEGWILKEIFL